MKGSEFVFDYVRLFYYKCHKINGEKWHYLAGKKLPALLRGMTYKKVMVIFIV